MSAPPQRAAPPAPRAAAFSAREVEARQPPAPAPDRTAARSERHDEREGEHARRRSRSRRRRGTLRGRAARMPRTARRAANSTPSAPPARGQQDALGQQLHARCGRGWRRARRAPRTRFCRAERARQQQVGHVGARDQQHEADGAEQDEQRPPHVADHLLVQRHDAEGEAAIRRIDIRDARGAAAR